VWRVRGGERAWRASVRVSERARVLENERTYLLEGSELLCLGGKLE
jgi:hypothetical protein